MYDAGKVGDNTHNTTYSSVTIKTFRKLPGQIEVTEGNFNWSIMILTSHRLPGYN